MKREISQKIEIPEGVGVEIKGNTITINGKMGEVKKRFNSGKIKMTKEGNKIIIEDKKASKKEKRMINTIAAHIKNMIKGVEENFEYKLKVVSSHFPITVEIHGNTAVVKNFLGEKTPRKIELPKGINAKLNGAFITVTSPDKELAGQAAANLERVTWIRMKDRRVFQDGIFIVNKAGKEI